MGEGYSCKCTCGYRKDFYLGGGFGYWNEQKKLNKRIRAGKYGEKLKRVLEEKPKGVFSAELRLYRCPGCDDLLTDYSMGFYEYNPELDQFGSGGKDFTYWMADREGWRLTRRVYHICKKCGSRLRNVADMNGLKCPECHKILCMPKMMNWD